MATLEDIANLLRQGQRRPPAHPPYYVTRTIAVNQNDQPQLQFLARAAIVDNLTNQWAFMPDAARFIPPFTTGKVLPLNGTQAPLIEWQTPPGLTAFVTIPGQVLSVSYTDQTLGPSDGSHLAFQFQNQIDSVTAASVTNRVITLPTGTMAVGVTPSLKLQTLTVVGQQTGTTYFAGNNLGANNPIVVPVFSTVDTGLLLSYTSAVTPTVTTYSLLGQPSVFTVTTSPMGWQAARNPSVGYNMVLAATASATILPIVAGQTIHVLGIKYQYPVGTASCFGKWWDTGVQSFAQVDLSMQLDGDWDCHGFPVTVDAPLAFSNSSAVDMTHTLQGAVTASSN